MFERYFAAALLIVAGAIALSACSSAPAPTQKASSPSTPKTALWKVTSAHRVMYVTGDMDVSLKKYPVPAALSSAFAASSELVLEGNPTPDKSKLMPLVMKYGLQPSGQTLSNELNPDQLKTVKKAFSEIGVPFAGMQRFRPWMAAVTLAGRAILKLGIKPHQMYLHFYDKAKDEKMPVTFLDTAAEELKMLAGMPKQLQVNMLMMTAKGALEPNQKEKRARLIKAWRNGDMETAAKIADKGFKGYPKLYKIMVTSRHPRWLKTLEAKLAKPGRPVLVIVGGPHLFGPGNLISGLRKAGYKVTQL